MNEYQVLYNFKYTVAKKRKTTLLVILLDNRVVPRFLATTVFYLPQSLAIVKLLLMSTIRCGLQLFILIQIKFNVMPK